MLSLAILIISVFNSRNVNQKDKSSLAFDNDELSKTFLATDGLETFVKFYRLDQDDLFIDSRKDVLNVKFEEIILYYEAWKKLILNFLDVGPSQHIRPNYSFKPRESEKNVGLWWHFSQKEEILFIESELREY